MTPAHHAKFVAYYRVSTGKQDLGIPAQKKAITEYLNGGTWTFAGEFEEKESGKRNDRPQLKKALALCRLKKAKLIIAKLDRLARNVAFISALMESKVEFICVDFPQANKFTIHILAAVAEYEAELISKRTKDALAVKKAELAKLAALPKREQRKLGLKGPLRLGTHRPELIAQYTAEGNKASAEARRKKAQERAADFKEVIEEIRAKGVTSHSGIARELNAQGHTAPRGGQWSQVQVGHLIRNMEAVA